VARTSIQQYADGNLGIRRGPTNLTMEPHRLLGPVDQVVDTLRWEFLGRGDSLSDEELERIAWRVISLLR
jgi:hypothetical protein